MKVVWSAWALQQLEEIHQWYAANATPAVADHIIVEILDAIRLLAQFPHGGQVEPWLQHHGLDHRRVVVGNHKVVYLVTPDEVRVIDVFDARQDPQRMRT